DPRPGRENPGSSASPVTGYPITVSLTPDDVKRFQSADARVVDSEGAPVDCWVTDPAHPSNRQAPSIYAKGVSNDWAFASNFGAIFIMPKAPLKKGMSYLVQVMLQIGSDSL